MVYDPQEYDLGTVDAGIPQRIEFYPTAGSHSPMKIWDHPIRYHSFFLYETKTIGRNCIVPHSYGYTITEDGGVPQARLDFDTVETGLIESRTYSVDDLIKLYERAPDPKSNK